MDEKIDEASVNILKVYLAQMSSAVKISEIICKHSSEDELSGDHIISGLVYRLMNPMSEDDIKSSFEFADNILDDEADDDEEEEEEEEGEDDEIEYKPPENSRKLVRNDCKCDICSRVRECLDQYETYETYDPLVTRFKDSIKETCEKNKIYI
mgnify:CR=1 FL=1|jgi:hypothetical protein